MRTISVDVGNTHIKVGLFEHDVCIDNQLLKSEEFDALIKKFTPNRVGFCSVKNGIFDLDEICNLNQVPFMVLKPGMVLNFKNQYQTPLTQGMDRVAAIAGAVKYAANGGVLVIDAGTCITYDFLDANLNYYGGAISPGLFTRLQSLQTFTQKLPLVALNWPEQLQGNSTEQSILSGVVYGVVDEISGRINRFTHTNGAIAVIITGGDADFLAKHLKNNIFAAPNLVLEGIHQLIKLNVSTG